VKEIYVNIPRSNNRELSYYFIVPELVPTYDPVLAPELRAINEGLN
jgi:hypothetical protein